MVVLSIIPAVAIALTVVYGSKHSECPQCFDGCHKTDPNKINIHLVPHTHDDAGWLKTVDQYYYRSNNGHAQGGVQHIIDSVLAELNADPTRRFVYVESSFLWRWWIDRNDFYHDLIQKLVSEGRLQLLHGGWVMSDEATTHYTMMIDQMTVGLQFLDNIFGECGHPKVAWQIDPFGHSAEVAQEFVDMGYDGVFYGRINQEDYLFRKNNMEMEMVWKIHPQDLNGEKSELFTGILYNLYHPPPGFCFDIMCSDEPIVDNKELHDYNVDNIVSDFIEKIKIWSTSYKSKHVMVLMGGDFTYMMAGTWFVNMDKLIKYGNANPKYNVNLLYSTPYCYLKALNHENISWPVKTKGDFFPYKSEDNVYWTGYFTSRPSLKLLTQKTNNLLQAAKQIDTFVNEGMSKEVERLERAVALLQHHDGISGTSKQHVTNDYLLYLSESISGGEKLFTTAFKVWTGHDNGHHSFCLQTNISQCDISERYSKFIVNIYNPLSQEASIFVRLPIRSDSSYTVINDEGKEIENEVIPISHGIQNIPGRMSSAMHDLFFEANSIPPMGYSSFYVNREWSGFRSNPLPVSANKSEQAQLNSQKTRDSIIKVFLDEDFKLIINNNSGKLHFVEINGKYLKLEQSFGYYGSGRTYFGGSGAYIFSPTDREEFSEIKTWSIYEGEQVVEIHQNFGSISQTIRLYKGKRFIEFDWVVGPISLRNNIAKEVVTNYRTSVENHNTFYTDSNGRRFIKREKNSTGSIESNYYPVTTAAKLVDHHNTFTVITDRAQGATSNKSGELEFMLHRRLVSDDGKGVVEPLNEIVYEKGLVVRGKHIVFYQENNKKNKIFEELKTTLMKIAFAPWISISNSFYTKEQWLQSHSKKVQFLNKSAVPANINILTLQKRSKNKVVLRLEHFYDIGEHSVLSKETTVDLNALFYQLNIKDVKEVTLGANRDMQCVDRMKWFYYGKSNNMSNLSPSSSPFIVKLKPMQIKTFILSVDRQFQFAFK